MKHLAAMVAFAIAAAPAVAQKAPTDAELTKLYNECHYNHRSSTQKMAGVTRLKVWEPGWENCSTIQDLYDEMRARQESAKSRVDEVAKSAKQ